MAWIEAGRESHRRAATLLGATDAVLHEINRPSTALLMADHELCERQARAALGEEAFAEAFRTGRQLTLDDALAYALDDRRAVPQPSTSDPAGLTNRERQVAVLIGAGLSNKEVAGRLVISPRSAESHVEHILAKLGFTSRSQVAAWISQEP